MQNMLYLIQFFSSPDSSNCITSSQAVIVDFADFAEMTDFTKLTELTEIFLPPRPTPVYKQSMISMLWNISISQLGLAAWLCSLPALVHLLIRRTWETEKRP